MSTPNTDSGLNQTLSPILAQIERALAASDFNDACNWAKQSVEAVRGEEDRELRAHVYTAITSVLVTATLSAKRAVLRGSGLFYQLTPTFEAMAKSARLLREMAQMKDAGLGQAFAFILEGFVKKAQGELAKHPQGGYRYTKAEELDAVLNDLDQIVQTSKKMTADADAGAVSPCCQVELAAVAIGNAQGCLVRIPKSWSDYPKAEVLVNHARKLVPDDAVETLFDTALAALKSQDYSRSSTALLRLHKTLSG